MCLFIQFLKFVNGPEEEKHKSRGRRAVMESGVYCCMIISHPHVSVGVQTTQFADFYEQVGPVTYLQ